MKCSSIGRSISSLAGILSIVALNFSLFNSIQAGTVKEPSSIFAFITGLSFLISLTAITSPALTKYEEISVFLPLIVLLVV